MSEAKSKPLQLIQFLKELAQIRSKVVHEVSGFEHCLWFDRVPRGSKHCWTALEESDEEPHSWLTVRRHDEPILPAPPEVCREWIEAGSLRDTAEGPRLVAEIEVRRELEVPDLDAGGITVQVSHETLKLDEHAQVQAAFDQYVETAWSAWAGAHQEWSRVQDVYTELFRIHSDQKRLGEDFEMVLGIGLCGWDPPTGVPVRRHLLTIAAELRFDAPHGSFEAGPTPSNDNLSLELEMLEPELHPRNLDEIRAKLEAAQGDPWDRSTVDSALHALVHSLDPGGSYDPTMDAEPERGRAKLRVTRSPALILRKRSRKGLIRLLDEMAKRVEEGVEFPPEFERLCEIESDDDRERSPEGEPQSLLPEEVYFPLPSNREQKQILERLSRNPGVLVQGPPGTGKSHTIANLICHLLATGHRILVTAQTPRALDVLQQKLPREIQDLCISLLGAGVAEQESLESRVKRIVDRRHDWNEQDELAHVQMLESKVANVRKDLAAVDDRIRNIRESETRTHTIAGRFSGTAAVIARAVHAEEQDHGWLSDSVEVDEPLPLTSGQLTELVLSGREVGLEVREQLALWRPSSDAMVDPSEFELRCGDLQRAEDFLESQPELGAGVDLPGLSTAPLEAVQDLGRCLFDLDAAIASAIRRPLPWLVGAVHDVLGDQDRPWLIRLVEFTKRLEEIHELVTRVRGHDVAGVSDAAVALADAKRLLGHLSSGGKLKTRLFFTPSVVKETESSLGSIRVDGGPPRDEERLKVLVDSLTLRLALEAAWSLVGSLAERVAGSQELEIAQLEEVHEALMPLQSVHDAVMAARAGAKAVSIHEPSWHDEDARESHRAACRREVRRRAVEAFGRDAAGWAQAMRPPSGVRAHPDVDALRVAMEQHDSSAYAEAHARLAGLVVIAGRLRPIREILAVLREHGPRVTDWIEEDPCDEDRLSRLATMPSAWQWAQARTWVSRLGSEEDLPALHRRRRDLEQRVGRTLAAISASKAWRFCLSHLTRDQQGHLVAWQQAMNKIGKGTGKYAATHRRNAQDHFSKCLGSIPAWVMPLHRVFDTVAADPGTFDVIIVDEASQCGPDSLPLMFLGKRIVVVGDDKQISPIAAGVNQQTVHNLAERHLAGFKMRTSFDLETSLFGHAERQFGGRIVLREHFRCAPEIIRFSNDLCYSNTPLVPLKQTLPDRLDPLVARHVLDGLREGADERVINRPEAEALVDALVACLEDPRYDGKSFGVITLQGKAQARLVETLLLERISTEEIEQRRLVCGEPYSFQGDERDIVLLSMIAANNERIGPMTRELYRQRFNVAASRAREQLWLFHSVMPGDLGAECFRRRLLEHFLDPGAQVERGLGFDPETLRVRAHQANRQIEDPPEPFESWFEVDVALEIIARDYRVRPQYTVADARIDLVVEGTEAQLAVECDGDHWHGPDQYDADMARQRKLERCGWRFVRIRESTFYATRESALDELWARLDEIGIVPVAQETADSALDAKPEPIVGPSGDPGSISEPEPSADAESKVRIGVPESDAAVAEADQGSTPLDLVVDPRVEPPAEAPELAAGSDRVPFSRLPVTFPDPRTGAEDLAIRDAILEIVRQDGPLPKDSAFRLYAKNSTFQHVTRPVRQVLNRVAYGLVREGTLLLEDEYPDGNPKHGILRLPGVPAVIVRPIGERTVEDIPPSELAEVMRREQSDGTGIEALYRTVLHRYGLVGLTDNVRAILEIARGML